VNQQRMRKQSCGIGFAAENLFNHMQNTDAQGGLDIKPLN
jgi:hypothetical protein